MKFKKLARVVRAFLTLGIFFAFFTLIMEFAGYIFNTPRYIPVFGGKLGDNGAPGTYLPIGVHISLPDTSIWYKNGSFENRIREKNENLGVAPIKDTVIRKVANTLKVSEKGDKITVYNDVTINGTARLKFHSKNKWHNLFWLLYGQIYTIAIAILLITLLKLTNLYMKDDFLKTRTFHLISLIGFILIFLDLFNLVCMVINARIIPSVQLETKGIIGAFSSGNVGLSFNFKPDYSNIGIGILIIILSKIIKDAVAIKQENDLTI